MTGPCPHHLLTSVMGSFVNVFANLVRPAEELMKIVLETKESENNFLVVPPRPSDFFYAPTRRSVIVFVLVLVDQ